MVLISEEVRNLRNFRGKKRGRVGGEAAGANGTRESLEFRSTKSEMKSLL